VISKEKLHVALPQPTAARLSGNNQAHLSDKSSALQSLPTQRQASCRHIDRNLGDRNRSEDVMTEPHEIHRRTDGAIDYDFYRARAVALRSQAIRDAFRRKSALKLTLAAMVGLMAFALAVASQTAQAGSW
jgi:hypothetical protein